MSAPLVHRILGGTLVPGATILATSPFMSVPAMAYPPGSPEPIRLRRRHAMIDSGVLALVAAGSYALSRSNVRPTVKHVAEGAALGSFLAAFAILVSAPPDPGPPAPFEPPKPLFAVGDTVTVSTRSLSAAERSSLGERVAIRLTRVTPVELSGAIEPPPPPGLGAITSITVPRTDVLFRVEAPSTGQRLLFETRPLDPRIITAPRAPSVDVRPEPEFFRQERIRLLTGQPTSGALCEEVLREVLAKYFEMNDYYKRVWHPRFGAGLPSELSIQSGYRSFNEQAGIVAGQLSGLTKESDDAAIRAALLRSLTTRSIPGFSRHHWVTEIDVVSADASEWKPAGRLARLLPFVHEEAPRFGFYTPYRDGQFPEPTRPHYDDEPWHLSYYPLASGFQEQWLSEVTPELGRLLDLAADRISRMVSVDRAALRRALSTLDLSSYVRNVAPVPSQPRTAGGPKRCVLRSPVATTNGDGVYGSPLPRGTVLEIYTTSIHRAPDGEMLYNVSQPGITTFLPIFARIRDVQAACGDLTVEMAG